MADIAWESLTEIQQAQLKTCIQGLDERVYWGSKPRGYRRGQGFPVRSLYKRALVDLQEEVEE